MAPEEKPITKECMKYITHKDAIKLVGSDSFTKFYPGGLF